MFIVSLLLFLLGMFTVGISFSVEGLQALLFVGGILMITVGMALPIHLRAR